MPTDDILRFADRFAARGTESRLRIMRLLLSAHPNGLVVGEIQTELGISGSKLSRHLDKWKNEDLVEVLLMDGMQRRRHRKFTVISP